MSAMPGGRSGLLPAAEADELMLGPQRCFLQLCAGEGQHTRVVGFKIA